MHGPHSSVSFRSRDIDGMRPCRHGAALTNIPCKPSWRGNAAWRGGEPLSPLGMHSSAPRLFDSQPFTGSDPLDFGFTGSELLDDSPGEDLTVSSAGAERTKRNLKSKRSTRRHGLGVRRPGGDGSRGHTDQDRTGRVPPSARPTSGFRMSTSWFSRSIRDLGKGRSFCFGLGLGGELRLGSTFASKNSLRAVDRQDRGSTGHPYNAVQPAVLYTNISPMSAIIVVIVTSAAFLQQRLPEISPTPRSKLVGTACNGSKSSIEGSRGGVLRRTG